MTCFVEYSVVCHNETALVSGTHDIYSKWQLASKVGITTFGYVQCPIS